MKRKTAWALAVALIATPAFAQKVTVDYDHEADFTKYSTYAWKEGSPIPNPLMDQRVVAAVEYHLAMNGLLKVESNPDLHVTYHASAAEEVVVDTNHYGYRYGPGWRWGGGVGTSTSTVRKYFKGTWVLDIWDAGAKTLIWRGTATDTISDKPEKNEKKINKGAEKMFEKFPPEKK